MLDLSNLSLSIYLFWDKDFIALAKNCIQIMRYRWHLSVSVSDQHNVKFSKVRIVF